MHEKSDVIGTDFNVAIEDIEAHIQHYKDGLITGLEARDKIFTELTKVDLHRLRVEDAKAHIDD